MILYPEIVLKNGRHIGSAPGSPSRRDALDLALFYADEGAEWLHLVDLDAAAGGPGDNETAVREILAASPIPVQVGGGVRCVADFERLIDGGAGGVVLGDRVAPPVDLIAECCERHPFCVVVRAEISGGRVASDWGARGCSTPPLRYARGFDRLDVAGLILCDAEYDPAFPEASLAIVAGAARNLATPVMVEGLARSIDDLGTLDRTGCIAGALIGAPLDRGDFSLGEALSSVYATPARKRWWGGGEAQGAA